MFGPNVKADERDFYYHHREENFHIILQSLETAFVEKFGLEDYNILFLTGSGTTANEAVIFSLAYNVECIFTDAEFGSRLRKMSSIHETSGLINIMQEDTDVDIVAYPYYETSISRLNFATTLVKPSDLVFLDMVSAFPYYLPPKGTAIWTTVSSKQLGAYPVLGIVAIHKDLNLDYFADQDGSSLNILGHLKFRAKYETLVTPAIPLYYDLLQKIRTFDREYLIKKINERRKKIIHRIGIDNIIGSGPVITFKPLDELTPVAKEFNLYKSKAGFQIFLWSGTDNEYESFYRALERAKNG